MKELNLFDSYEENSEEELLGLSKFHNNGTEFTGMFFSQKDVFDLKYTYKNFLSCPSSFLYLEPSSVVTSYNQILKEEQPILTLVFNYKLSNCKSIIDLLYNHFISYSCYFGVLSDNNRLVITILNKNSKNENPVKALADFYYSYFTTFDISQTRLDLIRDNILVTSYAESQLDKRLNSVKDILKSIPRERFNLNFCLFFDYRDIAFTFDNNDLDDFLFLVNKLKDKPFTRDIVDIIIKRGRDNFKEPAKNEVVSFIENFLYLLNSPDAECILISQFQNKYSYHFALMLQDTFKRGSICVDKLCGKIVWVDEDNTAYNILGIYPDMPINTMIVPLQNNI